MKQRTNRNGGRARGRKPASKGQVDNLQQQVEKQKGEIELLRKTKTSKNNNFRNLQGKSKRRNPGSYGPYNTMYSTINRKRGNYDHQWNDYLNHLMDPTLKDAYIPDMLMLPYTTIQCRTVGELKTSSDGTFALMVAVSPEFQGFIYDGVFPASTNPASITINGTEYEATGSGPDYFPCTPYTDLAATVLSYRPVSMGVYFKYTAPPIDAKGRISSACIPPADSYQDYDTYSELSNYNYSFTGAAIEGLTQVWFPGGSNSFKIQGLGVGSENFDLKDFPIIMITGDGLPADTKIGEIVIVMNIEAFSTNQLLTAPKPRIASQPQVDHAMSTASHVYVKNGGAHKGSAHSDHKPWWREALSIGKEVAETAVPILSTLLPMFM
jgi:hypothetical protein